MEETKMSMKSMIKQNVKPGDKIQVHHVNGKEYEGKILNMDATNPADFSIVMEDDDGDRYIMGISASMGVVMISAEEANASDKKHGKRTHFKDVHSVK